MKNVRWYWMLLGLVAAIAAVPGCAKNNGGGTTPPTTGPSSSASSSPTPPAACPTENPNTAGNLVVVDETLTAVPTLDPQYGSINGYVVDGAPNPSQAAVIDQYYPTGSQSPKPITSNNILQFTNTDSSGVSHSAISITPPFPPNTYKFPTSAQSPSPNTVIGGGFWSTGVWPPVDSNANQCFSQTFTLKAGTFYFGDYQYYDLSLMRDVLIVSSATQAVHHRSPIRRP